MNAASAAEPTSPGDQAEELLVGGNVNQVVRIGDTVRRPAGPWTPAVHALLTHLHGAGFPAPRPFGIDEQGREVLSFVPGEVVWPDHFDTVAPADRLARVGRLVRDFHDAVEGFVPPPDARWNALIPADGADLIIHHDLAPWNLVVDGADGWTLIDWDAAAPGTRLWDLAYAAHGFVPLSADPRFQVWDTRARLRVLVDAYGLDEAQRRALVPMLSVRARSMYDMLATESAAGREPWSTLWGEGHGQIWSDDADWISRREADWLAVLLG